MSSFKRKLQHCGEEKGGREGGREGKREDVPEKIPLEFPPSWASGEKEEASSRVVEEETGVSVGEGAGEAALLALEGDLKEGREGGREGGRDGGRGVHVNGMNPIKNKEGWEPSIKFSSHLPSSFPPSLPTYRVHVESPLRQHQQVLRVPAVVAPEEAWCEGGRERGREGG